MQIYLLPTSLPSTRIYAGRTLNSITLSWNALKQNLLFPRSLNKTLTLHQYYTISHRHAPGGTCHCHLQVLCCREYAVNTFLSRCAVAVREHDRRATRPIWQVYLANGGATGRDIEVWAGTFCPPLLTMKSTTGALPVVKGFRDSVYVCISATTSV